MFAASRPFRGKHRGVLYADEKATMLVWSCRHEHKTVKAAVDCAKRELRCR